MAQAPALAIPSFCRGTGAAPKSPVVISPQFSVLFPTLAVLPDSTSNSGATQDGTSKLVPWLRLAFGERLNFTFAPLCPQEDPLLVKTRSGVGQASTLYSPSFLSSSAFCRPLSSLASALQTCAQDVGLRFAARFLASYSQEPRGYRGSCSWVRRSQEDLRTQAGSPIYPVDLRA